jgi:Lar family restriction alleviation protein
MMNLNRSKYEYRDNVRDCPFCGSMDVMQTEFNHTTFTKCMNCGAIVSFEGAESQNEATFRWNSRKETNNE